MAKKIWNIVVVPEGGGAVRSLRVPARVLYIAAGVLVLSVTLAAGSIGLHLWTAQGLNRLQVLKRENASLQHNVDRMNRTLEQVETMVRKGEEMERQARLLAGLNVDDEARTAGVGGPFLGSPSWLESDGNLMEALPRSADAGLGGVPAGLGVGPGASLGLGPGAGFGLGPVTGLGLGPVAGLSAGSGAAFGAGHSLVYPALRPAGELDPISVLGGRGDRLDRLTRDIEARRRSFDETLTSLRKLGERLDQTPSISPLRGPHVVSGRYGWRTDPFTGEKAFHAGVDLRADSGATVHATAAGEVVFSGWEGDFGLKVRILHGHGHETSYCHLRETTVKEGQSVARGEIIGRVGSTGRSTGPHLHYEITVNGEQKNPATFMLQSSSAFAARAW